MPAVEIIRSWGLHVKFGKHLFSRRNSFAGTDNQRAADFQQMLDNPNYVPFYVHAADMAPYE